MIVGDLSIAQLRSRMAGPGVSVRTGPVTARIRSRLDAVVEGVALHYGQHPLLDGQDFADFDVGVERPGGLRGWYQPQVIFTFDGQEPFTPLPGNQGFPMLEWGLNWCMYSMCHHFLTMHGAVLERNGLAVIMPAPSGSGKSTLCAGLAFRGWRLLSDELAVVQPATGQLVPVPRPISLKNKSIAVIRDYAPDAAFGPSVTDTTKGTVCHVRPPADALLKADQTAQARWVVFPKYVAGAPAELRPISRAQTFMALMGQAFNYHVHGREGFAILAALVEDCEGYEFTYSQLDEAVAVFDQLAARSSQNR